MTLATPKCKLYFADGWTRDQALISAAVITNLLTPAIDETVSIIATHIESVEEFYAYLPEKLQNGTNLVKLREQLNKNRDKYRQLREEPGKFKKINNLMIFLYNMCISVFLFPLFSSVTRELVLVQYSGNFYRGRVVDKVADKIKVTNSYLSIRLFTYESFFRFFSLIMGLVQWSHYRTCTNGKKVLR